LKSQKIFFASVCAAALLIFATGAIAWEASGTIPGTEIEFSNLQVTKKGLTVRLINSANSDVKVSLEVSFIDRTGNGIGHSIFGLREIQAGTYVDISGNYLSGAWKACKDAPRMEWRKMTYEYLY
jgi:hypothetical protein